MPETQLENGQNIPAPAAPAQGTDTGALLEHILNSNQSNLGELARKASIPVQGPHATEMPATMGPRQPGQPGQLDHREVVGKGNARAQGIGNSVIAVMNAISQTETAVDNKKRQEVASATHQLITAQQAADQAKQVLQNDPNNQAAKEAYQQNITIMNGILGQDKIRKAIAKGMNIDFTDPKANDTLEHQGVAAGKDMAKRSNTYADQFNQKTPTTVAPNEQAIAQYKAAMEQEKERRENFKAVIPAIVEQMRAGTEWDKAKLDSATELRKTAITAQAKLDEQILKNKQDDKDIAAARSLEILKGSQARLTAAATKGDPAIILKTFNDASGDYSKILADNQTRREALNKQLDAESKEGRRQEIRQQLLHIDDMDETARETFTMNRNFAASMAHVPVESLKIPTVHVGDGANGTGSGTTSTKPRAKEYNPNTGRAYEPGTPAVTKVLNSLIHSTVYGAEAITGTVKKVTGTTEPKSD